MRALTGLTATVTGRLVSLWPGLLILLLGGPVATINMIASVADARGPYTPRTFYVARWGSDLNPGTDPHHPWRSLHHVNKVLLRPGDTVLFRGGETFTDAPLMPGSAGTFISGTASAPITFASYGRDVAHLREGVYFTSSRHRPSGPSHLVFRNLALGPDRGFFGTGNWISLGQLHIANILSRGREVGIQTEGSHWRIVENTITRTGDSGMLLGFTSSTAGVPPGGIDYYVARNVISNTGLDPNITYGTHGIYDKVANATIVANTISSFRDDGISVRYRNANIVDNVIGHGSIGIGWFQYDTTAGTSRFVGNAIDDTSDAAIFVCGTRESCQPALENFVIAGNRLRDTRGNIFNLQPTLGTYQVANNTRRR